MIADLKPYPEYKDSGLPWVGSVPGHWDVRRLKSYLVRNDAGVWGTAFDDRGTVVLRSTEQSVAGGWRISNPARIRLSDAQIASALLAVGDLVVTKSSGSALHIGKTSLVTPRIAEMECCFSNFLQRLRVSHNSLSPKFAWTLLNSCIGREQYVFHTTTTTGLGNLNGTILGNCVFPFPPLEEQAAIVRFLDWANGRLERAIRAKRKIITLLNEQKQAIIHRAVTRGLDPNAPLKPSGIPWLGDIPAHWEVTRIKNELECHNTKRIPVSAVERGTMTSRAYDYYGASGVIDKVDDYLFDGEYLLIAEDGANLVLRNLPLAIIARGKFWVNNHAHILKPRRGNIEYLAQRLETVNYGPWISGAAQPKLTQERLLSITIAVAPPDEQDTIVAYTNEQTRPIVNTVSRLEHEIALLREYRTRLTSDVVTGKLDVRAAASRLPQEAAPEMDDEEALADETDLDTSETEA